MCWSLGAFCAVDVGAMLEAPTARGVVGVVLSCGAPVSGWFAADQLVSGLEFAFELDAATDAFDEESSQGPNVRLWSTQPSWKGRLGSLVVSEYCVRGGQGYVR